MDGKLWRPRGPRRESRRCGTLDAARRKGHSRRKPQQAMGAGTVAPNCPQLRNLLRRRTIEEQQQGQQEHQQQEEQQEEQAQQQALPEFAKLSFDFPVFVFAWCSFSFAVVLLWVCFGVPFVSFSFPLVLHRVLLGSPLVSFRFSWVFPRASFVFDGVCFGFL